MRILNLATSIFLTVLAIDLLYLYYSGAWYEPIKAIEYSEVAFLYMLIILGIIGFTQNLKRITR